MHSVPNVLAAVFFLLATGANAAELKRVDGKDNKTRIDLIGEIGEGDADKLKSIVKDANEARRVVVTIRLDSIGGNLLEGVRIADVVKFGRIATAVRSGSTCASACFIIFAAGQERYAHYTARVGVHGASDEKGQETVQSGAATVTMGRLVSALGVPPSIIGKMVVTPPSDMVWLTVDDLRTMNVTMLGKPMQVPSTQQVLPQAPQSIAPPNVQAAAPPSSAPPTWSEFFNRAVELSKSQNNGTARMGRTCQPEFRICIYGLWYEDNKGREILVRAEEDLKGTIVKREICTFNDFKDIRTCMDWETGQTVRGMKNSKGDWVGVD
jgi:hypothetical protein